MIRGGAASVCTVCLSVSMDVSALIYTVCSFLPYRSGGDGGGCYHINLYRLFVCLHGRFSLDLYRLFVPPPVREGTGVGVSVSVCTVCSSVYVGET